MGAFKLNLLKLSSHTKSENVLDSASSKTGNCDIGLTMSAVSWPQNRQTTLKIAELNWGDFQMSNLGTRSEIRF